MARYSFTTYGIPKYGELENNRSYYNVGLRAWSYDYETISIIWGSVNSDPADLSSASIVSYSIQDNVATINTSAPHNFIQNLRVYIIGVSEDINGFYNIDTIPSTTSFTFEITEANTPLTTLSPNGTATVGRPTHWKLVKSFAGTPNNPYDGILVDGDTISNYRLSYIDSQTLTEGLEVDYSFWVFNGIKWINCGSTSTVFVAETDSLDKITKWIPRAWLNPEGDATGEPNSANSLYKTLDAYAFEYDKLRTEADLLFKSSNYKRIPSSILRNKIIDLGFNYEPALGDTYHRALYGVGNIVNGIKGTAAAVNAYTTALTHWSNNIVVGHNLLLDYNDSSFEESLGRWVQSAGSFDRHTFANSLAGVGVQVTAPSPGLYDLLFPPRAVAFGHIHGHNAAVTLSLPGNTYNKVTYGIPIKANTRYLFTGWVRVKEASKVGTIQARINWYNSSGTLISSESYNSAVTGSTTWKEFNSGSTTGRNGKLSPSNAVYAGVDILFTPVDNQVEFFLDMLQFAEAKYSLEYQDARLVQVVVWGEKENLLTNPSFDSGTGGWYSLNSTLIQDFNPPQTAIVYGDAVAKLIATSDQDRVALVSDWIPIEPGESYAFSIYVSGSAHNATARIEFSVPQSADEQTTVLTDEDGKFYPTTPYIVDSDPVALTNNAQRLSVIATSPVYTSDSGKPLAKVSVYVDTADINDEFYFDAGLFEQNSVIDAFFTGDGAPIPSNPITETFFNIEDCRWENKKVINFVSNSSLEDTTGWVAGSGSTLTSVSEVAALFGTKQGKISKAGGGSVSTTVYLPSAAIGGEDVVVSAYVRNKAGSYSISTSGQAIGIFTVSESNKDEWTRIHVTRILTPGETSFDITLSLNTGNGSAAVFYFDGVQAEYGRVPSRFVDPAGVETVTRTNVLNPAVNMYLSKAESRGGGKSLFWTTYTDKYVRLFTTLPKILPYGSTWSLIPGKIDVVYPELEESLIPSASFENDLGTWSGVSANLVRSVPRGTLFEETCSHGTAFCRVTATASNPFGIVSEDIPVSSGSGYYASIAIKPENQDAYGLYELNITFYDAFDIAVISRSDTVEVRRSDRWAYLSTYATSLETNGAVRAVLEVTATPDTPEPGHTFHIDRVVFRE